MNLSIASYNVLAEAYIRPERYRGVDPHWLDPARRRAALLAKIAARADAVICLQEVEPALFASLEERQLTRGYRGHYASKAQDKPDGCAIFLDPDSEALATLGIALGHGPQVALAVVVRVQGATLGVATSHMRYSSPSAPHVTEGQAETLLAQLEGVRPAPEAWVVCGDMNAGPDSRLAAVFRQAGFQDAYASLPTLHTCHANGSSERIDFLFYSAGLRAEPEVFAALPGDRALPGPGEPSDHRLIAACFEGSWGG